MVPVIPKDIKKDMEMIEPYMYACRIREDAPKEVVEADKRVNEWFMETFKDELV